LNELGKRVLVAAIGIPLALGLIIAGGIIFNIVIIIIAMIGIYEFAYLVDKKSSDVQKAGMYLFSLIILLTFSFLTKPHEIAAALVIQLLLMVLSSYSFQLKKGTQDGLLSVSAVYNSVLYVGLGFSTLIIIRNFNLYLLYWRDIFNQSSFIYNLKFAESQTWGLIVLFVFVSIWTCDSFAFFIGRKFGKHKLHPEVSPKKSWEGAIAGLIGAVIAFTVICFFFLPELPLVFSLIAGLIIGTVGQIGDLAESLLKRDAGIKDSSNLIPGHGGVLDRFDSALFVFPALTVFFLIIAVWG